MAAISCFRPSSIPHFKRNHHHGVRCCTSSGDDKKETPQVLKIAVNGVTEILRLFSYSGQQQQQRLETVSYTQDKASVCSVDDVVAALESDYDNAYFLTGNFTSEIYAQDCTFEDPTISFRGKDLYSHNLKLLVPFFDHPSLILQQISKGVKYEINYVLATWKLRTYLKFPWRPLISIEGSTIYDLDGDFRIVRHAESWNVSAFQALGQLFTPSLRGNSE
ncbi:hypothetical protein GIB67_029015 [Kingdonia uniflora]|uniref:NTF2-like domain-containing protein n=1 Tax=Kingdonia uniflora TaxID=39325 RepID=A0A7J7N6I0_9MAGN|nr:hypothetical protein GIB67_029015 [Kingdonia uniflora]